MDKCGGCLQLIDKNDGTMKCSHCKMHYHELCIKNATHVPISAVILSNWLCPNCQPKTVRGDNTPVRSNASIKVPALDDNVTRRKKAISTNTPDISQLNSPLTQTEVRDIVKVEIKDLIKHLNDTMTNFVNKGLKSIKDEIAQVNESMKFMNAQYEEIRTEISNKFATVTQLQKDNEHLKSTVKELNTRINIMEQQARSSNIEIHCMPEHKGENLVSSVVNLSRVISCELTENNIHHVTRVAKRDPTSSRPKSIVVQFNSPRVRDTFLAASIKYNKNNPDDKLNSHLLGIGGKKESIFIAEHLSPTNKLLHAEARKKAKDNNYKFVWVRNGKIFMRKSEGSDYKYIKDFDSLMKLE